MSGRATKRRRRTDQHGEQASVAESDDASASAAASVNPTVTPAMPVPAAPSPPSAGLSGARTSGRKRRVKDMSAYEVESTADSAAATAAPFSAAPIPAPRSLNIHDDAMDGEDEEEYAAGGEDYDDGDGAEGEGDDGATGIDVDDDSASESVAAEAALASLSLQRFPNKFYLHHNLYTPIDLHLFFGSSLFEDAASAQLALENGGQLPTLLPRSEWNALRRLTGAPRRFSRAFLQAERRRTDIAREAARIGHRSALIPGAVAPVGPVAVPLLPEGSAVLALHPTLQGWAPATIVGAAAIPAASEGYRLTQRPRLPTHDGSSTVSIASLSAAAAALPAPASTHSPAVHGATHVVYRVRFDGAPRAGPQLVTDSQLFLRPGHISIQGLLRPEQAQTAAKRVSARSATKLLQDELFGTGEGRVVGNGVIPSSAPLFQAEADVPLVAELLQLVDRKKALLDQLQIMNEAAMAMRNYVKPESGPFSGADVPPASPQPALTQPESGSSNLLPNEVKREQSETSVSASAGATQDQFSASLMDVSSIAGDSTAASAANPSASLTAAQFAAGYDLFQRQYAYVVLQLEATSHALGGALDALTKRRAAAARAARHAAMRDARMRWRRGQLMLPPSGGELDGNGADNAQSIHVQGRDLVRMVARKMVDEGSLPANAAVATTDSPVQQLLSHAIALVIMIQRVLESGASGAWFSSVSEPLLRSIEPEHPQHRELYESIVASVHQLREGLFGDGSTAM